MRKSGTITHWNAEKGYGFITPESGGDRVFVHINAFGSRIPPPKPNETVTFSLSKDRQGRPCAEQVLREGEISPVETLPPMKPRAPAPRAGDSHWPKSTPREAPRNTARRRINPSGRGGSVMLLVAVIAAGAFSFYKLQQPAEALQSPMVPLSSPAQVAPPKFHCDGRTHCSHMSSCEEAFFFIRNCPGTQMDGDGDGVPCERQLCG